MLAFDFNCLYLSFSETKSFLIWRLLPEINMKMTFNVRYKISIIRKLYMHIFSYFSYRPTVGLRAKGPESYFFMYRNSIKNP